MSEHLVCHSTGKMENYILEIRDTIDTANKYNQERTRFQKGNQQGIRFAKKEEPTDNQLELDTEN